MSLKDTGGDRRNLFPRGSDKMFVQNLRFRGLEGTRERGPATLSAVCQERKLGNDEHSSARIKEGMIHFSIRVFENPQPGYFVIQIIAVRPPIALFNAEKNDETGSDGADNFSLNRNLATIDALYQDLHYNIDSFMQTQSYDGQPSRFS